MSRVGKVPVSIPAKVKVDVKDTTVSVEGPKGAPSLPSSPSPSPIPR